jgi:hypothetical protein
MECGMGPEWAWSVAWSVAWALVGLVGRCGAAGRALKQESPLPGPMYVGNATVRQLRVWCCHLVLPLPLLLLLPPVV